MGLVVNRVSREKITLNLNDTEIKMYQKRFEIMDKDKKGFISINDIRRGLKVRLYLLNCMTDFRI